MDDEKPRAEPKQMTVKTAKRFMAEAKNKEEREPVVEATLKELVDEYEFEGGLDQAIESVRAAGDRKGNAEIREALETYESYVYGSAAEEDFNNADHEEL